jgi:hypothetical protein
MSGRFRIRTSTGQELSFASHDVFAEFVRSGELQPDDVVYDAETKEWSSARTHPVVLQIEVETEASVRAGGSAQGEDVAVLAPEEVSTPPAEMVGPATLSDIGLDLAPAPSQMTPEQESAAFVARMEAERASNLDIDREAPLQGFTMEQGGPAVHQPAPDPVAPPRTEPRPSRRDAPAWQPEPPRYESSVRDETSDRPQPSRLKTGGAGEGRRYAPLVIVLLAAVGAGVYFGPELLTSGAGTSEEPVTDGVVTPPPPPPVIADNEEAIRRRAQERFFSTTQAQLRGLGPIPDVWLRGSYLAAPSDYPNVRTVWDQYLTTIREVRAGDDERYRQAYLRALDDARVDGAARTLRLASATTDFQAAAPGRNRHYDRVEDLAIAALQGHDALVQAEGTIAYQPASGRGVSADPVIEAVGRGPQAQAVLNQILDMILTELQGPGGPGEAANVREWVGAGLLDAVAN